jgi:hypothetical protein
MRRVGWLLCVVTVSIVSAAKQSVPAAPSGFTVSTDIPEEIADTYRTQPAPDASLSGMSLFELQQLYGQSTGVDVSGDIQTMAIGALEKKIDELDSIEITPEVQKSVDELLTKEKELEEQATAQAQQLAADAAAKFDEMQQKVTAEGAKLAATGEDWLSQNLTTLVGGVGGAVGAPLVIWGVSALVKRSAKSAMDSLSQKKASSDDVLRGLTQELAKTRAGAAYDVPRQMEPYKRAR